MLSVHNLNWHLFYGDDSGGAESCLSCGGIWEFTDVTDPEFPKSVDRTYHASNGDAPKHCSGISQNHGDGPCEADNGRECQTFQDTGTCPHMAYSDCNCVFCA